MMKINIKKFSKLTYKQKDERSKYRHIHIKKDYQLKELIDLYPKKIEHLKLMIADISDKEELEFLKAKIIRLTDKYATTLGEINLRKKKIYPRKPIGTTYYIDLTNGNNARTGLKIGDNTIDSTADTTHFVDAALTGIDDYINGSYFWNVTRGLGSLITDFDAASDTVTLADAIAGMSAGDTYYILDSWLTLEQYTTTTVRTAGDIAYVRANTTETVGANDIVMDEDGTKDAYISIIGCDSVTSDPWSDGSDIRPIIDFGDQIQNMYLNGDDYWKLERLDIIQSADTVGTIRNTFNYGMYILNCIIRDNSAAATQNGVIFDYSHNCKVENCQFKDNISNNCYFTALGTCTFINCTFDGGVTGTAIGINNTGSTITVVDCSFGQTTAHITQDILTQYAGFTHTINCKRQKSIYSATIGSIISSEDDNQVKGANVIYAWNGIVTKDTGVVRPGGASSSAKLAPNSSCGLYAPLSIAPFNEHDFKIYCTAAEITITIYIRSLGVWAAYPTNSQLYIEASYLDHAVNATRTEIASTAVLNDETTWQPFSVTFTPLQAGYVYLKVYLKKYQASKGCYVDMKIGNKLFDWVNAMPIELKPSSTGFIML